MLTYEGSIEDVLRSGEYDSGDKVVLDYDELYDLVEQAKSFVKIFSESWSLPGDSGTGGSAVLSALEQRWNRPLHPCFGGKSPYSEFLPL